MRPTPAAFRRAARAHFNDPTKRRGLLVAFEGPDGSGKTTQRKLFKTWLKSEGYDVVATKWNSSELIKRSKLKDKSEKRKVRSDRHPTFSTFTRCLSSFYTFTFIF